MVAIQAATPIRAMIARPIQKAEKLPATRPERMLSEAPPSREAVTTSLTWRDSVEVKTLTSSGMIAPASVPQVMIVESFHHSVVSPARSGMSSVRRHEGDGDRDDRGQPDERGQRRLEVHLVGVAGTWRLAIASLIQ